VALQVLTPDIRLYGLAVYALTATFTPNLAAPLAALWTDVVDDWRFIFFEAAPLCAAAGAMIWFGVVQTPPQLDRLRRFDATGVLLVAIGFGGLAVVFEEGDWLDWFNSPLICVLTLSSAVAIPLFFVNETRVKIPLIRLELLKRRNFLYASITLIVFLVVALSASQVPLSFLEQVRGFRPLQAQGLTLMIAASQLVLLPATALLLDIPWLDSRLVSAVGLVCILTACLIAAAASSAWSVGQFVVSEALQSVGFSFVVMPLLMMATNAVKPEEGPYASALINTPRAVAEGLGVWVVDLIGRWRGGLHRVRILEILGQERLKVVQAEPVLGLNRPALSPNGTAAQPGALEALNQAVTQQASTLTTIDTFLIQAGLVLFLMVVLAVLPERTYPPRIALAKS
jgi:DHA2 family multidrug resistance protein